MKTRGFLVLTAAAVLAVVLGLAARPTAAALVLPQEVGGNPTCQQLGYVHGFRIDPPLPGVYNVPYAGTVTWTTTDGVHFDWSSTFGIDAVTSKGGSGANVYRYDPPAESFGDTGLHSPVNASGDPAAISHIDFCYDFEVTVTKTADTTFTRDWDWTITKSVDEATLKLSNGQTHVVNYTVELGATFTDSDWAVLGEITIHNPDPFITAQIAAVTDNISGFGDVTVSCPATSILPGGDLTCTYGPVALPDGSARVNTATVITTGLVGGGSDTADVIFGNPTNETDECVTVTDSLAGALGSVCAGDEDKTITYPYTIVGACDMPDVVNTASFVTNDNAETGDAQATVTVEVACQTGCTLTPGYWKTHSIYGPAPYDDTWDLIGENTTFFGSGQSYYDVLWTTPQGGNAYYILAHAYIAAQLNVLNGATGLPAVQFDAATALFETYTPANIDALKGNNALRAQFIALAGVLDAYNNGLTGPGHCSE